MAGFPLADPLIGLLITVAILLVLRGAATDIYRRLMDAVEPELTAEATATLRGTPGVSDIEHVRLRWIGHRLCAEAGVVVDEHLDLVTAHDIATDAHHRLLHELPKLAAVTIHVSPRSAGGVDHHRVLGDHEQGPL
jgi:divalent metal cation (Fe/Co/Zn/Cd) transporter